MKKLLFFLLLFVNLQCVIQEDGSIQFSAFTTVQAQHMTREPGDNCYLAEIGWFYSALPNCGVPDVTVYRCGFCPAFFYDPTERENHQENCPNKKTDYHCEKCNSDFSSSDELSRHVCKPYKCDYSGCNQCFQTQEDLDKHKESHKKSPDDENGENDEGQGGGSGGGTAGGSPGGSPSGKSKKPKLGPTDLWCQTQKGDCVPTAIANFSLLTDVANKEESVKIWNGIKNDFESRNHDPDYFDKNGIKVDSIPKIMEQFGVIGEQSYQTYCDIYEISTAVDTFQSVLGILNPHGEIKGNNDSHAVNIIGYTKNSKGTLESFLVFDPLVCEEVVITDLSTMCRGYVNSKAKKKK